MTENNPAISAIATPIGVGGISVVRISGEGSFAIADKIFLGKSKLNEAPSHTAHFGKIVDHNGGFVDEVVAVVYRKPNSYTCEDIVEISCHGGYLVTQKVLQQTIDAGARLAEPGEFTKRAFLNGRIDLSQAEAIGDLIHSQSEAAYRSSLRQLSGDLSWKIKSISDELLNLASLLELELDFSEEDVEFANRKSLEDRLQKAINVVDELLSSYEVGRIYREGVRVAIAGKPNAGKSSLLNALLQENRAIVSETPGTTRDTISESVSINGILFRLTDTAGLREAMDNIEREGVDRARKEAEQSDVVLLVIDCESHDYNGSEPSYKELADACTRRNVKLIKVWNKIDIYKGTAPRKQEDGFFVSALCGDGIDFLKDGLFKIALGQQMNESSVVVTNTRHRDLLSRAQRNLRLALETLKSGKSGEFVALDLRGGLNALGEITGEITTNDVLNNIFSKFCIGK
ncbi:MAG TPA: tRNA uridine-5-carboxymethylaminomethyl(34) synthesis GTPase MnmE [Candidatus Acidoferrales bacterium]|nr:tRNA uridine-5-carboxymethylaminomethyl(34) synthesis GTPase MnmE [Candidatus Acidoferrales bacterium]